MEQAIAALEGIQRYGLDTLSGRTDGPDDREWQRAGVNEMTKRARLGIAPLRAALAEPAPDQKTIGWIDDDARLGWAMWRIKDLEQQLGSRPAPQAQQPAPPADVPMLSTQERLNIITQFTIAGTLGDLIVHVEKLVRQKAGLK